MPRYEFTTGQVLTAGQMNDLSDQTVMVFDSSAARGSAIPTPSEGMVTYRSDDDVVEVFDGSAFVPVAEDPVAPAILQVVSTTKTDTFTSSSTSFVDITDLSLAITPSATSSKVLVLISVASGNTANTSWGFQFVRDSTPIAIGDAAGSRRRSTIGQYFGGNQSDHNTATQQVLDSPNTTSAVTYKLQGRTGTGGTFTINRQGLDSDNDQQPRTVSTITLMEVAG